MATRAPKGSTRPRGGNSGEFRAEPTSSARRKPAAGSRSTTRSPAKPRSGSSRTRTTSRSKASSARGRRPAPARSRDPVLILVGWVGHALAAAWMVAATSLGFAARRVGNSARDLDPEPIGRDCLAHQALAVGLDGGAKLGEDLIESP